MSKENEQAEQSAIKNDTETKDAKISGPYENIISQVVEKIRNEPFLFVIAVIALLIGLTILASGLGSSDLRFLIIIIAVLAFVVGNRVVGFVAERAFHSGGLQLGSESQRQQDEERKGEYALHTDLQGHGRFPPYRGPTPRRPTALQWSDCVPDRRCCG